MLASGLKDDYRQICAKSHAEEILNEAQAAEVTAAIAEARKSS